MHNGRSITVVIPNLAVPQCKNCGELVFDYDAEKQINDAYQAQIRALADDNGVDQRSRLPNTPQPALPPSVPRI
jgi:hypothetical protein